MKKAVILLVLGMVLVGMTPIAMSEEGIDEPPWEDRNGDGQNDGEQGHVGPDDGEGSPYDGQYQNGPNGDQTET